MFDHINPALFDDSDCREDTVREEIIVPILKRLGYALDGPYTIVRSRPLKHPYVMIGSKKHPASIVPDYLLCVNGRPAIVLDAKSPSQKLTNSKHAEQAYSYAIHPEVRAGYYALCNGREFVVYSIHGIAPLVNLPFDEYHDQWQTLESVLSPKNFDFDASTDLVLDLGTMLLKTGIPMGAEWIFPIVRFTDFMQITHDIFTMSVSFQADNTNYLATFDCSRQSLERILNATDTENRDFILNSLADGQMVYSKRPIHLKVTTTIGQPTKGSHDEFVPFMIDSTETLDAETLENIDEILSRPQSPT